MTVPIRVRFTDHAAERAHRYTVPRTDVADAVLTGHHHRHRNTGAGDWLVQAGGLAVVYDWPDHDDDTTARVITLSLEE